MTNTPDDTESSSVITMTNFAPKMVALLAFLVLLIGALKSGLLSILERGHQDYLAYEGVLLLIFGVASIGLIGRKLGLNAIWLVCYTSIPLGLVWSTYEYIQMLASVDPTNANELTLRIITMLFPIITAALICTLAFFAMPEEPPLNNVKISIPALTAFSIFPYCILSLGIVFVWGIQTAILILHVDAGLVLLGAVGLGLCRRHIYTRPFNQFLVEDYANALMDGGKICAFFGAATCALFYIPLSRLGEPSALGQVLSLNVTGVLYGSLAYSVAVILSSRTLDRKSQDRLSLDLWHLGESYAFILLATLAPKSLFDFVG